MQIRTYFKYGHTLSIRMMSSPGKAAFIPMYMKNVCKLLGDYIFHFLFPTYSIATWDKTIKPLARIYHFDISPSARRFTDFYSCS